MRQQVAFVAVLAVAAGLGALLVMPGRRAVEVEPAAPAVTDEIATSAPAPPPRKSVEPVVAKVPTVPAYVRVDPASATSCGAGMVLVEGTYCPYVGHRCAVYEDEARDVCKSFAAEAICEGALQRRRFCIDTYEYPNVAGVRPAVWVGFDDAKRACAIEGKRLCAAEEWELACEGTGMWPYPYGLERNDAACNDVGGERPARAADAAKLDDPWTRGAEIGRSDGRWPAGAGSACVSPFGVVDLIGNVEEWVDNAAGQPGSKPFRTARKGGSWAHGKGRCRPMDASEPGWYRARDLGFRCCADASGATPAVATAGPDTPAPPRKRALVPPSP